jgi:hypothetical protein
MTVHAAIAEQPAACAQLTQVVVHWSSHVIWCWVQVCLHRPLEHCEAQSCSCEAQFEAHDASVERQDGEGTHAASMGLGASIEASDGAASSVVPASTSASGPGRSDPSARAAPSGEET